MDAVDSHINHITALIQYHPQYTSYQPPIYCTTVPNDIYYALRYKNQTGTPTNPCYPHIDANKISDPISAPTSSMGSAHPATCTSTYFYDDHVLELSPSFNSSDLYVPPIKTHPYGKYVIFYSLDYIHHPVIINDI